MPHQPDASASAVSLLYRRQRWMAQMRTIRSVARTVTVLGLGGLVGFTLVDGSGLGSWSTATSLVLAAGILTWVVQVVHEHRIASHQLDSRVLVARMRTLEVERATTERRPGPIGKHRRTGS
ncbi:MAG: hypothetical protein ABIS35_10615 [Terracoccus sp.]